jgi:hypothetical protein
MAANADCKIQISYGKDGLLLNIYAQDSIEAEKLINNDVQDMATLIESVGSSLGRSNPIKQVVEQYLMQRKHWVLHQ